MHVQHLDTSLAPEATTAGWASLPRPRSLTSPRGFHDYRSPAGLPGMVPGSGGCAAGEGGEAAGFGSQGGPDADTPGAPAVPVDPEVVARRTGRSFGHAVAQKEASGPMPRREATARLAVLMDTCGLGGINVLSMAPLVVRVAVAQPGAVEDRGARCGHVAGFLEGALASLLGCGTRVREIDCVSLGNTYCTFAVET